MVRIKFATKRAWSAAVFALAVTGVVLGPRSPSLWGMAERPPAALVSTLPVLEAVSSAHREEGPEYTLSDLIAEALEKNPELWSFRERWKAAKARVWQEMSWDNTMLGVDFEGIPAGRADADRAGNIEWMISQKIPFPGKRFLAGRVAAKEARMAFEDLHAKEREIVKQVKQAYFELFLREREAWNHEETREILERMSKSAEARYASGLVPFHEVLMVQSELAMITNDIAKHHQQRDTALARIRMLLGWGDSSPLRVMSVVPERTHALAKEQLVELALRERPELRGMRYGFEAARTDSKRAWLDLLPDGEFRIEARHFSGESGIREYDQFFGFEVPVLSLPGRFAHIREKRAQARSAEGAWENMKNMVRLEVEEAWAEFDTERRTVEVFAASILQQAESAAQAAVTEYVTGRGDFLRAMEAENALTEFRHEYFHSLAMREQSFADLERAVGVSLEEEVL